LLCDFSQAFDFFSTDCAAFPLIVGVTWRAIALAWPRRVLQATAAKRTTMEHKLSLSGSALFYLRYDFRGTLRFACN